MAMLAGSGACAVAEASAGGERTALFDVWRALLHEDVPSPRTEIVHKLDVGVPTLGKDFPEEE